MSQALIAALTGGLAGGVISTLAAPFIQRWIQKKVAMVTLRQNAIRDFMIWSNKTWELYMTNEACWVGGARPQNARATLGDPLYGPFKIAADISIRICFREAQHQEFKAFADWLDRVLAEAFQGAALFPFADFHTKRETLAKDLISHLWD